MTTNIIDFTARAANSNIRPAPSVPTGRGRDNVVSLAAWLGRARARRTPTGVFFTTRVLTAPGQIA